MHGAAPGGAANTEPRAFTEPVCVADPAPAAPAPRPPVTCEGPGWEHVFRPRGDETVCPPCAQEAAWRVHSATWAVCAPDQGEGFELPEPPAWRERVAAVLAEGAADGG